MQAVIGAAAARATGLEPGDRFSGAHGFSEAGHAHESQPYTVVGILAPLETVADRLILTSLESVWELHGHGDEGEQPEHDEEGRQHEHGDESEHDEDHDHDGAHEHDHADEHEDDHAREHEDDHASEHEDGHALEHEQPHESQAEDPDLEITAMLLRYRTPLAAMSLPGEINAAGGLQAASPAVEIARILQLVGLGMEGLRAFAWVLIVTACLSVFAALYGSLRSRRVDLAMLRCLGATRYEVFFAMLSEGLILSIMGIALGYSLGQVNPPAAQ